MIAAAWTFIADKGKSILRAAFVDQDSLAKKQIEIDAISTEIRRIDQLQIMSQSPAWADFDNSLSEQIEKLRLELEEDNADSKVTKEVLKAVRAVRKWLPDMIAKRVQLQENLNKLVDGND